MWELVTVSVPRRCSDSVEHGSHTSFTSDQPVTPHVVTVHTDQSRQWHCHLCQYREIIPTTTGLTSSTGSSTFCARFSCLHVYVFIQSFRCLPHHSSCYKKNMHQISRASTSNDKLIGNPCLICIWLRQPQLIARVVTMCLDASAGVVKHHVSRSLFLYYI